MMHSFVSANKTNNRASWNSFLITWGDYDKGGGRHLGEILKNIPNQIIRRTISYAVRFIKVGGSEGLIYRRKEQRCNFSPFFSKEQMA